MGLTKTDLFTEEQNELASVAKVLGHPARIAIIERLLEKNECVCGTLVHELGLAQATISQHLRELKDVGLVKGNIEGTAVCYCINEEKWRQVEALFTDLFQRYQHTNECC
ncbi:MAG: transcriptional regulator [Bacteroidetes bacterium SW_11_45_7]|nr:MAG: transcriptional regulator [Bacteroidetes bacterium SW_11_45_7]